MAHSTQRGALINAPGIRWEEILQLVGQKILARKGERGDIQGENGDVLLHLPGKVKQKTNWMRIYLVGEACREFTQEHVGDWIHVPEWRDGMHKLDDVHNDGFWIIDEKTIGDRDTNTVTKPYTIEG